MAGCGLFGSTDDPDASDDALRELERKAIGTALEYPGAAIDEKGEEALRTSKKKRRELGWSIAAKVLQPTKTQAKLGDAGVQAPVPLFRTWYGGDEFERMFAENFSRIGAKRRAARDGASAQEIEGLLAWNAQYLGPSSEADYFKRITRVKSQLQADGLGSNARMAYSPGYVRHYFGDYAAAVGCENKLDGFTFETPPTSDANFTNCFGREFDVSTAVIKTSWRRNDNASHGMPVYDTTAKNLKRLIGDTTATGGAWPVEDDSGKGGPPIVDITDDKAYSIKLERGEKYALGGMHIMTKELRHWTWVTLWWSNKPNDDFGQDRPKEISDLGGPWGNYKMCVVTSFDEGDNDPRGGFSGSLGDALEAVHGDSSWCSNPFIERGAHNAQTNCMGCHQHAGDPKMLRQILSLPASGRKLVRKSFPADYSWAFMTPDSPDPKDRLLKMMLTHVKAYDTEVVPDDPPAPQNSSGTPDASAPDGNDDQP